MVDRSAGGADRHVAAEAGDRRRAPAVVERLHPASFAFVMATGIVSIALQLQGVHWLALALAAAGAAGYALLWLLTIWRAVAAPRAVLADLSDHGRSVGFFTTVAATGVVGAQLLLVLPRPRLALALWWLALGLWLVLSYAVFTALTVKERKPPLAEGIHGGWLLAVVATQAVANLAALLLPHVGDASDRLAFVALAGWLAGGMLYGWIISLIFYRYTFFPLHPSDLMPPYWINMGAMAISTLAGASLVGQARAQPLVHALLPFVRGMTLLSWATATWWIPMLLILGAWRHVYRRYPLAYDPLYWGAVFPLGMYSACTYRLAGALELPFLLPLARAFAWIALAAWIAAFAGLGRAVTRRSGHR
jgi:tellurite resistance protein TehA-like permease